MLNIKPIKLPKIIKADNVAKLLSDSERSAVANYVMEGIDEDKRTMEGYKRRVKGAMKLARMDSGGKNKTFPFDGASNLLMPYLAEAAIEFNSRTMQELYNRNLVGYTVIGDDSDGRKEQRGRRVQTAINYVFNHELDAGDYQWREDTDRALLHFPITGMFFRKNWYCARSEEQKSAILYSTELIYDHSCENFYQAPRHSHQLNYDKNKVINLMRSGIFLEMELPDERLGTGSSDDHSDSSEPQNSGAGYDFLECHCWLDLDGDEYAEPYIVTISMDNNQLASIERRFEEADIEMGEDGKGVANIDDEEMFTQYGFIPDPSDKAKAVYQGWGTMLFAALEAINTSHNQQIDAATLQITSANSGFIDSSVASTAGQKGKVDMIMGQFTGIQTGASSRPLRDSIVNFPFAGPSQAMLQLTEMLKDDLRRMMSASYYAEGNPGEAAELYLARLQQSLKIPNSLSQRLHKSLTRECSRISWLISNYMTADKYNDILDERDEEGNPIHYFPEVDFNDDTVEVAPTADPRLGSEQERITKASIVYNEAKTQQLPAIDYRASLINYFEALGIDNIDKLVPQPPPPKEEGEQDMLQQLQAMMMQSEARARQIEADADMVSAQARMLDSQTKAAKVEAEIEKIISETIENLSQSESEKVRQQFINIVYAKRLEVVNQ